MASTLTRSDLIGWMHNRRGCFAVTITAETDPRLLKTGNPYRDCVKLSRVNGLLNWIYSNSVNAQRQREGNVETFHAEPRRWGERVIRPDGTVTPLVFHKGQYYLELKVQQSLEYEYRDGQGNTLDKNAVEAFLPPRQESSRQGVDRPVILRDYAVESIRQIAIDGTVYDVVP